MNRTELIHSLCQNETEKGQFISKSVRGNTLWTLWKDEEYFIVAYQLLTDSNGWIPKREDESLPPTTYTCPQKYLNMSPSICEDWRNKVREYETTRKSKKEIIKELFRTKRKDQKIQITIRAKKGYVLRIHNNVLKEAVLYVVSILPGIEARFPKNGLRYSVPLRLVTDIKLLEPEC